MLGLTAGMLVLMAAPVAAISMPSAPLAPVRVSPATAGPHATIRVSVKSPDRTGVDGGSLVTDAVTASGPGGQHCVSRATRLLPAVAMHAWAGVSLDPTRFGGSWCTGRFRGEVVEFRRFVCPPTRGRVCPFVLVAPRTIARFHFRVARNG